MVADSSVSAEERAKLSPWQCDVLAAVRAAPNIKVAAARLGRSRDAVDMALSRIRLKGVEP